MTTTHPTDSAAMTAAEFRVAIETLGIDQVAAAELLGVTGRTVRRWIAGTHDIPAGAAEQINALADEGVSVNEIARTVGVSWPTVAKRRPDAVWSAKEAAEWGAFFKRLQGK